MQNINDEKYIYFNIGLIPDQYNWLSGYSEKIGGSMVSIIRHALRDYKEKYDKK